MNYSAGGLVLEKFVFGTVDYIVLGAVLAVSLGIGVYEAFAGGKQKTIKEYMVANRSMNFLPISASLFASFISPVTLIGMPAETYAFGSQTLWIAIAPYIAIPITAFFYMPIYYRMRLTSTYEYLSVRFNSYAVRLSAGIIFCITMVLYMGVVMYGPALAFDAVTGLDWKITAVVIVAVGTIYTTIGGMKAVLWADTFQSVIIIGGIILLVAKGFIEAGGFSEAWNLAVEGGRLEPPNFDPDPTARRTVWSTVIGFTMTWIAIYGVDQANVQRALSCKSLWHARAAYFLAMFGIATIHSLAMVCGILIFVHYRECDPLKAGAIKKPDQILPFFAMEMLRFLPGLPGLMFACVCSGALSTLSSGLNSMAAVVIVDMVKKKWPNTDEGFLAKVSKGLSLVFGIVVLGITFLCDVLAEPNVLVLFNKLTGVTRGALLGVFTLGIFVPCTNWIGAATGLAAGIISVAVILTGSVVSGYRSIPLKTVCNLNITSNVTTTAMMMTTALSESSPADVFPLFKLSDLWYAPLSFLVTFLIGVLVSVVTKPQRPGSVNGGSLWYVYKYCTCTMYMKAWAKTIFIPKAKEDDAMNNNDDREESSSEPGTGEQTTYL